MPIEAVSLRRGGAAALARLAAERADGAVPEGSAADLLAAQQVAYDLGPWLPLPGQGDTLTLWEALASLGAADLTIARVAEPHLDALAILREARRHGGIDEHDWNAGSPGWSAAKLWQVYAAEGGERLRATAGDDGWRLTGVKPRCSVADLATHALVTAWAGDDRRLFAVDLGQDGVLRPDDTHAGQAACWPAPGLTQVPSTSLTFDDVRATAIGGPGWFLTRPGFAWGRAGVAAIWYGACAALARTLLETTRQREPDQVALLHLGAVDTALARARAVLVEGASVADDPDATEAETVLVTQRVRQVVADSADEILLRLGHALGAAPLTGDEDLLRRVAALTVHLRQHHAERDLALQGSLLLQQTEGWTW